MAKGRRSSSQSAQKLDVKKKDIGVNRREYHLQPGNPRLSNVYTYQSEAPKDNLKKLPLQTNIESLYTEIDSNNRVFLLKNETSERVECCGLPADLAASYRRQVLISAEKRELEESIVKASSDNQDRLVLDTHEETNTLVTEPRSSEPSKKKRRPVPVNTSPTKRRRSNFLELTKPSTVSDEGEIHSESKGEREEQDEEDEEEDEDEDEDGEFEGTTFEQRDVRVCELDPAMEDIMKSLQQKGLKRILKVWLGKCHAQKQANFPYNGGGGQKRMKKAGDPASDNRNPGERSAPDYWPSQDNWSADKSHIGPGVRHKEPDHLLKHERTNLCKQLLRAGNRYKDAQFDLNAMEESTANVEKEHPRDFRPSARRLIDSLYYARRKEMEYERGEIDADTIVYIDVKVPHTPRPKRRTRPYRKTKKPKQSTPELDGFFDFGLPIKPSPSANSSFNSNFKKSIRIESERSTPLPDGLLSATTSSSHGSAQMETINARRDSHLSKVSRQGQGAAQRSAETTPSPSEGDTEINEFDLASETDNHLNRSSSQNVAVHPGSHGEQDEEKPRGLTTGRPMNPPSIYRGQLGQGSHFYSMSTPEQYTAVVQSSPFVSSATTKLPHCTPTKSDNGDCYNTISPSTQHVYTSNSHNGQHQSIPGPSPFYSTYPPHAGLNNHLIVPAPTPAHNPTFTVPMIPTNQALATAPVSQPQTLVSGYPSGASSEFNGAMPIDSEWHNVDMAYEHFRDGTYQMQQQHDANNLSLVTGNHYHQPQSHGPQETQDQKGLNNTSMTSLGGVWPTEWGAMAHDPQRYCPLVTQPQPAQMHMHGMAHPAAVAPGVVVGNHGAMQRLGSGYGYAPSLGGRS